MSNLPPVDGELARVVTASGDTVVVRESYGLTKPALVIGTAICQSYVWTPALGLRDLERIRDCLNEFIVLERVKARRKGKKR